MKFIHCADIHLGSKLTAKLPNDKAKERRAELRGTVNRLVNEAAAAEASAILICGDLFDGDMPAKKDKDMFYNAVRNNPDIDFYYLRGNHDNGEMYEESFPNLKYFGDSWTKYEYEENGRKTVICGIELEDCKEDFYASLELDENDFNENDFNIVMIHGQISDSEGQENIVIKKLAGKNIDYLALGHVHSYSEGTVDKRGIYCYSGCPFGRGFDETGEKGYVFLDTEKGNVPEFRQLAGRIIEEKDMDISGARNIYEVRERARTLFGKEKDDLLRLNVTGDRYFDCETLAGDIEDELRYSRYFVSVKDRTVRKFDPEEYASNTSLTGEFVRNVLGCEELSEEDKNRIISYGLRALRGEEMD